MIIKNILLKCIRKIHPILDVITGTMILLLSPFLKYFVMFGAKRNPITTYLFKKIGVFAINDHFYQPLFNDAHITKPLSSDRDLPGIKLNVGGQLDFLDSLTYEEQIIKLNMIDGFPVDKDGIVHFKLNNGSYKAGDADFLYQFIRTIKPRRIIEIGAGNSTKLIYRANQEHRDLYKITHTCIEPYLQPWLENLDLDVIRTKVEQQNINIFKELNAGDFLFIDSSHMIRPQGDVLFEILNILPILKSGVYVHFHDIFTPKDYLDTWIRKDIRFWNEQYLLEALLSNSDRYEIVAALNYLHNNHYRKLQKKCPNLNESAIPGAFYIKIV